MHMANSRKYSFRNGDWFLYQQPQDSAVQLHKAKRKKTMYYSSQKISRMGRSCSHLAIFSCIFAHYFFSLFCVSPARDTLGVNESIVLISGDLLESSNQRFRITITRPRSGLWDLAIQYVSNDSNHLSISVWTHDNYLSPASTKPAYLTMNADGRLVAYDSSHNLLIVVNSQQPVTFSNTTATLLDNGNLVLRAAGGNTVWQSFDYPTNKWLQGMKLGIFEISTSVLTSAPSFVQPTSTLGVDSNNAKEIIIIQDGVVYWRSGMWNGKKFSFLEFSDNFDLNFNYVSNPNEMYFTWNSSDPFALLELSTTANVTVFNGDFTNSEVLAVCDEIGEKAAGKNLSMGCTHPCGVGDGFKEVMGDFDVWDESSDDGSPLGYCKLKCRKNCSCYAYSNTSYDKNGAGLGCKMAWSRKGKFISSDKQGIFVRQSFVLEKGLGPPPTPSPELAPSPPSVVDPTKKKSEIWKLMLSFGALGTFLGALSLLYLCCNLQSKIRYREDLGQFQLRDKRDHESPIFEFSSIEIATDHFSEEKKLGQGGFGPVYKGKLPTGQEIAVKRLNTMSGYGIEQFKNEVEVISKLQHRNLVKLLGYCVHGEERILLYEYLLNNSLDSFIFDTTKRLILDWKRRWHIIEGIAQGLLYLHKYSRLKIIHRDLKTSNILLDNDLNPKISDFGTARIFGDNETRANTLKIVGTCGYMSPEYAMNGIISEKTDVYSFGVMMLEIISGKMNISFSETDDHLNLVGHVWDLWKEGRVSDISDPSLGEQIPKHENEISRYVQVALLCVEENAAYRPTMSDVVSMLNNDSLAGLPVPIRPAFSATKNYRNKDNFIQNPESCSCSNNTATISDLEAR